MIKNRFRNSEIYGIRQLQTLLKEKQPQNITILSFYLEVPMQAMEYSGDTITSSDSVAIKRVLMIGEEIRKAKSSGLYLFAVKRNKSTSSDDDDLSGTTYSDTAVGGSKASKIK